MKYGRKPNMKCPNCGEIVEVLRTRNTKKDLYVTEHPDNTCPAKYKLAAYRQTEEDCEDAYTQYRKELVDE